MSANSNIDRETFRWVRTEVDVTLDRARLELQGYITSDNKEDLYELINDLHQVVGSLQMLELKSLSSLMMESELLVEDYSQADSDIGKSSFVVLLDSAFSTLNSSFDLIELGSPERPIEVVELINQIRAIRGLEDIEIGALFSPMIEVFPEVDSQRALKDVEYIHRAKALRKLYQAYLLQWLISQETDAAKRISVVFEKLSQMSTFGSVSRIWWVATAYADYLRTNEIKNKSVHGRILRELDDRLRSLELQGESALVRDPGEELIRMMLLYVATSEHRSAKMDQIFDAFSLQDYFPAVESETDATDIAKLSVALQSLGEEISAPVARIRELTAEYFENTSADSDALEVISEHLKSIVETARKHEADVITELLDESRNTIKGLRNDTINSDENTAFYLASALMYIDSSVSDVQNFDRNSLNNGLQKLKSLRALNNHEELLPNADELTDHDRQALLDAVSSEVALSIKEIETKVEAFSQDPEDTKLLVGTEETIRQIKGAVQVLGDQKLSLFLQLVEEQFAQIDQGKTKATPRLIEALAISIGVTEEYVKGLKMGRTKMDYLLDRGHSDLEVALGKKVSRADVETLLDQSSDSLFSWLADQSNFDLFTNLKINLRDLSTLARKTGLTNLDQIIREQNRMVDIISQEPAYLTDNITGNLQNNMASVTEQLLQLYGTEDTEEELAKEAEEAYKRSAIEEDDDGPQIYDDMDISTLGDDIEIANDDSVSLTAIGKQNAVDDEHDPQVDQVILEAFIEESAEILESANFLYTDCVADPNNREAIRDLRRGFHTLKGSSRMVGLNNIGEVAWYSESLFNYVLDTEKPLTKPILKFARDALDTIQQHSEQEYVAQSEIDVDAWGLKTDAVPLDEEAEVSAGTDLELSSQSSNDGEAGINLQEPDEVIELQSVSYINDSSPSNHSVVDSEQKAGTEPKDSLEPENSLLLEGGLNIDDEAEIESAAQNLESGDHDNQNAQDQGKPDETIEIVDSHRYEENDSDLIDFDLDDDLIVLADDDLEAVSFLAIEDSEMRDIFVLEAKSSLGKLEAHLDKEPLFIEQDDAFSIAVHTLMGNARTMGLTEVAIAYDKAERFCACKQQTGDAVSDDERAALSDLLLATRSCVESRRDNVPYFNIDEESWSSSAQQFQAFLELYKSTDAELEPVDEEEGILTIEDATGAHSSVMIEIPDSFHEKDSDLLLDLDSYLQEDDLDDNLQDSENIESTVENELSETDSSDEAILETDQQIDAVMPERLAAAFKDLELSDEWLGDQTSPAGSDDTQSDEDLAGLEQSLDAFNSGQAGQRKSVQIDQDDSVDEVDEIDEERASLIPDDLTNLLEDDILELSSTMEIVGSAQQVSADIEAPVADTSAGKSSNYTDENDELRDVFIEELRSLHIELDNEVASLQDMQDAPSTMPKVMRHLHTLKGSALMANAQSLGSLTHDVESYLESAFIRSDDDVRKIRKTLETYIDNLYIAADAYKQNDTFEVSNDLRQKLDHNQSLVDERDSGIIDDAPSEIDSFAEQDREKIPNVDNDRKGLNAEDLSEQVAELSSQMAKVDKKWKSARGWKKVQIKKLAVFDQYRVVIADNSQLQTLSVLLNEIVAYAKPLTVKTAGEFKYAKKVLHDAHTLLNDNAKALLLGKATRDSTSIRNQLGSLEASQQARPEQNQKKPVDTEASLFVPGADEVNLENIDDLAAQAKAAQERAAELKIKTETLDSLTNYVGDASMNRSQMREDVLAVKNVVEELYTNVERFGAQLRELEIEADSRISSRTSESLTRERGEEFDPLELDRYTKLQQLSRGLTENLDNLNDIQNALTSFVNKTEASLQKQDRLNRELQDEIMQVRLVSFGGLGPQLRQIVRRTGKELNKEVELEIIGTEVRMDKTILDGVAPALEHMLRNAVDHGIELPAIRKKKKKPTVGKIIVKCRQVAREIVISVRDDGAGLDLEKIRAKAIENNLLAVDQLLKPEDILMYISQSGFSTAASLTQISGRGVGMDVVQSTLRRMSGSISYDIDSEEEGSHFIIRLPISLTVSTAMFVHAGEEQFAIAARTIERVINVEADQLITLLKEDKPTIEAGAQQYNLIDLTEYLGYRSNLQFAETKLSVVLVNAGVQNVAVIVDSLDDTQEIVVKNLGAHLGSIPIYSGATIRADGRVVLLLDLIGISYYESIVSVSDIGMHVDNSDSKVPTIMVVDDSLTVRKSAERDITSLGINVVLLKDGLDAQVELRQNKPDMILLDIEMPRMDGFELLEWVKSDDNVKDIPVVMISSRATEKYVKKATELGCSAFLGKPYLLENMVSVFNQFLQLDAPIKLERDK